MIKVYHVNSLFKRAEVSMALHMGTAQTKITTLWNLNPDDIELVAHVDTDSLDEAFLQTNNIDHYWGDNLGVKVFGKEHHRSTSVGDFLETEDGKRFMVDNVGFLEIPDRRLAEGPLDKLPLNLGIHPCIDELIEKRLKEGK
jgi:hypothetical protein